MTGRIQATQFPRVSVILPAYNAALYIAQAIESILAQTFGDLEVIVIDDGSSDSTWEIAGSFLDPRVKVLRNERNRGLVPTLNRGIAESNGALIARMDADDISLPERLALELELLESNPRLGVVSCGYDVVDPTSKSVRSVLLPTEDPQIRRDLYCKTHCFCHAAALMRRTAVDDVGGYRQEWFPAEDRDLWLRMLESWHGANLSKVLYRVRAHEDSVSGTNSGRQADLVVASTVRALQRPKAPSDVDPAVSHEAWSRGHLFAAFGTACHGDQSTVTYHFEEAVTLDRDTAHRSFGELLRDRIAGYMHNHDADVPGADALVRLVFRALPEGLADQARLQPAMLAQVRAIAAFHHAQEGARRQARGQALRAILRDRRQLHNRGLVKLALGLRLSNS